MLEVGRDVPNTNGKTADKTDLKLKASPEMKRVCMMKCPIQEAIQL